MRIITDHELELYDWAYRTGFRAGQLAWRRKMIADHQCMHGELAGHRIAVTRGNISVEEYAQLWKEIGNDASLDKLD